MHSKESSSAFSSLDELIRFATMSLFLTSQFCLEDASILHHIYAQTLTCMILEPFQYIKTKLYWALTYFCSAASAYHLPAALLPCGTPLQISCRQPILFWAAAWSCSERGVYSRIEIAKSPLSAASNYFWKSAHQDTRTFLKSTTIIRQLVSVSRFIGEAWHRMSGVGSLWL